MFFVGYKKALTGILIVIIFFVAIMLRVLLAMVNVDANDPHIRMIEILAFQGRVPSVKEERLAFHPKLYHGLLAIALKGREELQPKDRIKIAQLITVLMGCITLGFVLKFLRKLSLPKSVYVISFALVALNPGLIGTDGQVTNNTLVIMFATAAAYFGYSFFKERGTRDYILMMVSAILAGLTKGNGLVVAVAISLTLLLMWLGEVLWGRLGNGRQPLFYLLMIFLIAYIVSVPLLGSYRNNNRTLGSYLALCEGGNNCPPQRTLPHFLKKTRLSGVKPGILSIVDGYFTFRLISLLQEPTVYLREGFPRHRMSLWSQLYGQTHFVHYLNWPKSWSSKSPSLFNVGRSIYILALPTLLIFLLGIVLRLWELVRSMFNKHKSCWPSLYMLLLVVGYLGMIIVFTMIYRDKSYIKVVYVAPCLLGVVYIFVRGYSLLYQFNFIGIKAIRNIIHTTLGLLIVMYVIDVLILVRQLGG